MYDKHMSGVAKAIAFVILVGVIAIWSLVFYAQKSPEILPHALFLAVLLINTFVSIRFFANIQPQNMGQVFIDALLAVIYIGLALVLGQPFLFAFVALLLFIFSPIKYALMLDTIPHTLLIKKKLLVNLCGTGACALLLAVTFLGYSIFAAWAFAISFTFANMYLLIINPMYRLSESK